MYHIGHTAVSQLVLTDCNLQPSLYGPINGELQLNDWSAILDSGLYQETAERDALKAGMNRTHGGAFVLSCIVSQPAVAQKSSHPEMRHTMLQRDTQRNKKKRLHHGVSRLLVATATHR